MTEQQQDHTDRAADQDLPDNPEHHQAETVDALEERVAGEAAERADGQEPEEQVRGEDVTDPDGGDGEADGDESTSEPAG
ncbi:hypothetical protein ACFP3Q_14060 [Nocardioides sp. GCM10027113]|uniref:hypothetical protein n=1 Tax=unclassified Nocardioides TaxID=2615069 RepID=UPI0036143B39